MVNSRWLTARAAVLGAAAAVALAGCTAEELPTMEVPAAPAPATADGDPGGEESSASTPASATAPAEVPAVWDWTAMDVVTGETVEGASYAGQDVILWFWAPWCPICNADAPGVASAQDRLPEGVVLLGVPGEADAESSRQFVADHSLGDFQHVYDPNGGLWAHYEVFAQPQFIAVNDDGTSEIIFAKLDEEGLVAAAEDLAAR